MVSEQLEESLRREIESYVEKRLSGIKQDVAQLQTQVNETCRLLLESEGEGQWDGSLAATVTEHLRAAHERGIELAASESARTQASSDMALVKAAVEEIQGQRSQSEILKALVNRGSSFAPRVAFFVMKGDQIRGWRARGFQGTVGDEALQQISFPLLADTVVSEVARSRTTWSGTPNSHSENHLLLSRMGEQEPQRIVAVPLVVHSKTVAVLYADSAGLDSEALNLEALETLVRFAGMAVQLISVSQAAAKPKVETTAEVPGAYTPTREYSEPAEPSPVAEPEPVAAVPEAAPVEPASSQHGAQAIPYVPFADEHATVEPVTDFTAEEVAAEPYSATGGPQAEEAPTFSSPAQLVAEPAPLAGRRRYGSYDADLPIAVSDEEERRAHNDARRFARLLVSEIKLYNEDKVVEGRSHGDLYTRLREYIDRSRDMYDKRVKPVVSGRYDYFHHELVNTLAEGDAAKLGEAYPGTTVSA
ncbi:MAG TPA: hypothetical protein VN920_17485 [Pyrinomonadaceae bacterium]|nr:hypothetical protein [Pyrinomonadaceae bacterium]